MKGLPLKLTLTVIVFSSTASFANINMMTNDLNSALSVKNKDLSQDEFYKNLEGSIPFSLYLTFGMAELVNTMMIESGQLDAKYSFTLSDSNTAACMQKALDSKFYKQALDNSYKNYIKTVSHKAFEKDRLFINHPDTTFNNSIYKNVFAKLAQNQTKEQNHQLSAQLEKQLIEYDEKTSPDILSETIYQNFGEKSAFDVAMKSQIEQCIISQNRLIEEMAQ